MFISSAYAQAAPAAGGTASTLTNLFPIILLFVVAYFLILRPGMKKEKERRAMVEALARGDEVATAGGIIGRITDLKEGVITVEIAKGVEIQVQRHAVTQVLPKGTFK